MARRASSLSRTAVGVNRDIGSEYDNVKEVADNLNVITNVDTNLNIVQFVSDNMQAIIDTATILGQEGLAAQADLDALEQALIEEGYKFRIQDTAPTDNVNEGVLWYNSLTNDMLIYRETAPTVFEWVSINVNNESTDSDIIDAGAF
jgi:hypothetical protein